MSNEKDNTIGIEADEPIGIRLGETIRVFTSPPDPKESLFAVMVADIPSLPEPHTTMTDTGPVESAAVVGAMWNGDAWQWCYWAPGLKELLGEIIFNNALFKRGQWYSFQFVSQGTEQIDTLINKILDLRLEEGTKTTTRWEERRRVADELKDLK